MIRRLVIAFSFCFTTVVVSGQELKELPGKTKSPDKAETPVRQDQDPSKPESKKQGKGPSQEKIRHAEEKSGGNAFSGHGTGGDKNMAEPSKTGKKAKAKSKGTGKGNGKSYGHEHEHKHDHDHGNKSDKAPDKK